MRASICPISAIRPQFALRLTLLVVALVTVVAQSEQKQSRFMSALVPSSEDRFYSLYGLFDDLDDRPKRDDGPMPGVLRFGKRAQSFVRFGRSDFVSKKEMPGVLRFGKRSDEEKKAVPGVFRFGKRDADDMPGVLRFGKRDDMPGVLRFGKRDSEMPGMLRFGRSEMPGVLRFGRK